MKLDEPQLTHASTKDGAQAVFENHPEVDEILLLKDEDRNFLGQVKSLKKERTEAPAFFHKETMVTPWKAELEILGELKEGGDKLKAPPSTVPSTNATIEQPSEEVLEKAESYLSRREDFELREYDLCEKAAEKLRSELKEENGYPNRGTVIANGKETGLLGELISKIEGEELYCQHEEDCPHSNTILFGDGKKGKFTIGEDTPITYFGGVGIPGNSTYPHLEAADKFWVMIICPGCGHQMKGKTAVSNLASQAENQQEEEIWRNLQGRL